MKFYTSVSTSTRGQARRAQNLLSSPQSPIHIVRSDAEKGLERIARTYALETYAINWCEYWPFLDTYVNLSSTDGLRLTEYYLQQRILHSQILKTIDLFEKFSAQYLSTENEKLSKNENDSVLNSLSELIQLFYSLADHLNLHDFTLNHSYRQHLESGGFVNQPNNILVTIKINIIQQLQHLSNQNQKILSLFNRALLNSLTMVFTLILSSSRCALIDQIQQNQYECQRYPAKIRPASRLSLIGLVCPKRKQSRRSLKSTNQIIRSNSWPDLLIIKETTSLRRCQSETNLNQNNNFYSSSNLLNETTRKSIQELSLSNNSSMFSSQLSVDMFKEDKSKIEKWHYFLAG